MLGFSPIASSPIADVGYSITASVTSQSLTGNVGTVAFATNNNITPTALQLTLTLHEESIQADSAKIIVLNLPALLTHVGADSVTAGGSVPLTGEALTSTLHSPHYAANNYIEVSGTALNATLTSVSVQNGHTIDVEGMGLTTTLHSLRLWHKINTAQSPVWTKIQT